jgi:hypothetical protein
MMQHSLGSHYADRLDRNLFEPLDFDGVNLHLGAAKQRAFFGRVRLADQI